MGVNPNDRTNRRNTIVLLALLPLVGCSPGQLAAEQELFAVDATLQDLQQQLPADPSACLDYLDLCERATSLCVMIGAAPETTAVCNDIKSRCDANLTKYCQDRPRDAGAAIQPEQGAIPAADGGAGAACGDSICRDGETCTSCPADCGPCPPLAPDAGPPHLTDSGVPPTGGTHVGPEVAGLPTSGSAWSAVKAAADSSPGTPNLCDQDNRTHPKVTLAAALVYARTGLTSYRDKAAAAILAAYPTQVVGCNNAVLSLGRQLSAYVLAADYIGLADAGFKSWLSAIRTKEIGGHGRWHVLRFTAGNSASNWGTFALTSIIAADRYLGDKAALAGDWAIFTGYTDGSWPFQKTAGYQPAYQCGGKLIPIDPSPCVLSGKNFDGTPVEDASRSPFPVPHAGYVAEAAQGMTLSALLLSRAGYPAWTIGSSAISRLAQMRSRFGILNNSSADRHVTWITNAVYGLGQPTLAAGFGRGFGFTDWLFGK